MNMPSVLIAALLVATESLLTRTKGIGHGIAA